MRGNTVVRYTDNIKLYKVRALRLTTQARKIALKRQPFRHPRQAPECLDLYCRDPNPGLGPYSTCRGLY